MSFTARHLVLDLDSTLVHSMMHKPAAWDKLKWKYHFGVVDADGQAGHGSYTEIWGVFRPGLFEFLRFARSYFAGVHVWSAGRKKYVHSICDLLFAPTPEVVLTYAECEFQGDTICKPLSKLFAIVPGANESNTLIIDDRPDTFAKNPDNALHIPAFEPDLEKNDTIPFDDALARIQAWLLDYRVILTPDVRWLDKKIFA